MKIISKIAAAALFSCSLCLHLQGASGDIQFGVGQIQFKDSMGNVTTDLLQAVQVSAWGSAQGVGTLPIEVTARSGDFSSATLGDAVTLAQPWIFNSGTPGSPMDGPAVSPLWSVDGFSFALASSHIVEQDSPSPGVNFLNVTGTGTVTGGNFNPGTPGTWTFTSSDSSSNTSTNFTFQSDTLAAVPEPSTWVAAVLALSTVIYSQRRKLSRLLNFAG